MDMSRQTNKKWKKCLKCGGRIYEHRPETHVCNPAGIIAEEKKGTIAQRVADSTKMPVTKKKSTMTIGQTKLGVTMVLSKEDCELLGFKKDATTKQAIKWTREKLGLPDKKKKGGQ